MSSLNHRLQTQRLSFIVGAVLLFLLGLLLGVVWSAQPPAVPLTRAQVPTATSTSPPAPQTLTTPLPAPVLDPTREAVRALQDVAPDAPVYLGEATEVLTISSRSPSNYIYRRFLDGDIARAVITNTVTGDVTSLGNDQGTVYLYDMTNTYVLWAFLCHKQGCDLADNPPLPTGYYLYDLETGTNRVFAAASRNGGVSVAQLSGDWVAFARPETRSTVHLYAANVRTQEEVVITENITFPEDEAFAITTRGVFTLMGTSVIWSEQEQLYRYDLTTNISETLNVPALLTPPRDTIQNDRDPAPRWLRASEQAVVWYSQWAWWGYDFETAHYFPIPPMRRTVANDPQPRVGYPSLVTVDADMVSWRVVEDTPAGRVISPLFAAPLVRPQ